jgi:ribosomal protein S12 methylthiotransferase accessory factor
MYEDLRDPTAHRRAFVMMTPPAGMRPFSQVAASTTHTFEEDVAWQLGRLRACGVRQAIAVNLTKPELRIPVVRVIIPGLEGIDDAPGAVPGPRAKGRAFGRPDGVAHP